MTWVAPRRSWVALTLLLTLAALGLPCSILGARAQLDRVDGWRERLAPALRASELESLSGSRPLVINGARLKVDVTSTDRTVTRVLDEFERHCGAHRAPSERAWPSALPIVPVVRTDGGRSGYAACFRDDGRSRQASEWLRRARDFLADGDLSTIGELAFVWAERGPERTRIVAVQPLGPLPLSRMFPTQGDAPGRDVPRLPRPPDSRRLLSGFQLGGDVLIASYRSRLAEQALLPRYRGRLAEAGFTVIERRHASGGRELVALRADRRALINIARAGTGTLVSVAML